MMITLQGFNGMLPKVHPNYLPDGAATFVENARLRSGALEPFNTETLDNTLPLVAGRVQIIAGAFKGIPAQANIVPGPVADDRFYVSGDGAPRLEGDTFSYPLALLAPTNQPFRTATAGTLDPNLREDVVFCYTFVTTFGEESQPSPLTNSIPYSPGMTISITGMVGSTQARAISAKRVYRSLTDGIGGTELYFIAEIPALSTSLDYVEGTYPIQEPLGTIDFDPPSDGIRGFTSMPNGIIAGFNGRNVYFCEPYQPHAWPLKYNLVTDYNIVGLASFGSTLAVMTRGQPYIISGIHPDNMAMEKVEENLPCTSGRGIVDLGYAAAYPSHDGLVLISQQGPKLITKGVFSRDDWQALQPTTMIAAQYEGYYAFIHQTTLGRRVGLIDLTGEQPFYMTCNVDGIDLSYDIETTRMFILGTDGRSIRRFDSPTGTPKTAVWRSKVFQIPYLTTYGVLRINTDKSAALTTSVNFYADGVLVDTINAMNSIERLAESSLADRFEVEVTTQNIVTSIEVAEGVQSLYGQ